MSQSIYNNKKSRNHIDVENEDGEINEGLSAVTKKKEDEIDNYILSLKKLGDNLRCSCCGDVYSDPVKLKCQHLMDRSCAVIKKIGSCIKCPICHHNTICEEVDELLTDFNRASQIPLKPDSLLDVINKQGGYLLKLYQEKKFFSHENNGDHPIKAKNPKKVSRWDIINNSSNSSFTDAIMTILSSQNSPRNVTMSQFKKFNEISNKSSIMSLLTKAVLQNVDVKVKKKKCKINDSYSDSDILKMISPQILDGLFALEKTQFVLLYRDALENGVIVPELKRQLSKSPPIQKPLSLINEDSKSTPKTFLSPESPSKDCSPKSHKDDYCPRFPKKAYSPKSRKNSPPRFHKKDYSPKSHKDASTRFHKNDYSPKYYKEDSSQKSPKSPEDSYPRFLKRKYSPKSHNDSSSRFFKRDYSPKSSKFNKEDSFPRFLKRKYSPKKYEDDSCPRFLKRKYSPKSFNDSSSRFHKREYSPKSYREDSSKKFEKRNCSPKALKRDYSPKFRDNNMSPKYDRRGRSPISLKRDRSPIIFKRGLSPKIFKNDSSPKSFDIKDSPRSEAIDSLSKYNTNDNLSRSLSKSSIKESSPISQKEESLSRFTQDPSPKSPISDPTQRVLRKHPSPMSNDSDYCDKVSITNYNMSDMPQSDDIPDEIIVQQYETKSNKLETVEETNVTKLCNDLFDTRQENVPEEKPISTNVDVVVVDESAQYRENVNRLHSIYSNMYHASLKMKELEHQMKSTDYQAAYKAYTDNYDEYHKLYASLQAVCNIESVVVKDTESQKPRNINIDSMTDIPVDDVSQHIHYQEQASSTISPGGYAPDSTDSLTDTNQYKPENEELNTEGDLKVGMSQDLTQCTKQSPSHVTVEKEKYGYLWLSNLGKDTRTNDLCQLFEKYGHVSKIKLFQYKAHTPITYFSLIFMPNVTEAETAYRELQNTTQFDRPLHIKMLDSDPLISNDERSVCV